MTLFGRVFPPGEPESLQVYEFATHCAYNKQWSQRDEVGRVILEYGGTPRRRRMPILDSGFRFDIGSLLMEDEATSQSFPALENVRKNVVDSPKRSPLSNIAFSQLILDREPERTRNRPHRRGGNQDGEESYIWQAKTGFFR